MSRSIAILVSLIGSAAIAQSPTTPSARTVDRVPGGYHTVSAVAGTAIGHKLLTPKSGGWTFRMSAEQFLANRSVDFWIVPRPFPKEEEFELARYGVKVQTARTNQDGELHKVLIDRTVVIGDTLVLDYEGDGQYVPQFDAKFDTWEWAKQVASRSRDLRAASRPIRR